MVPQNGGRDDVPHAQAQYQSQEGLPAEKKILLLASTLVLLVSKSKNSVSSRNDYFH